MYDLQVQDVNWLELRSRYPWRYRF